MSLEFHYNYTDMIGFPVLFCNITQSTKHIPVKDQHIVKYSVRSSFPVGRASFVYNKVYGLRVQNNHQLHL